MIVLALITQKGGCGKTTLSTCLAVMAAKKGYHPLILDTDSQGSASAWWESRDEDSPALIEVRGDEIDQAITSAKAKQFDVVLIDTPARAEPVNAAAAAAADFCLIPCQPSMADMRAQAPTVQTVKRLEKRGAFILTRCPPRGKRIAEAESGLLVFGLPVCPVPVVNRTAYPDAYGSSLGVSEYEPEGKAAKEIAALWDWITRKISKGS